MQPHMSNRRERVSYIIKGQYRARTRRERIATEPRNEIIHTHKCIKHNNIQTEFPPWAKSSLAFWGEVEAGRPDCFSHIYIYIILYTFLSHSANVLIPQTIAYHIRKDVLSQKLYHYLNSGVTGGRRSTGTGGGGGSCGRRKPPMEGGITNQQN